MTVRNCRGRHDELLQLELRRESEHELTVFFVFGKNRVGKSERFTFAKRVVVAVHLIEHSEPRQQLSSRRFFLQGQTTNVLEVFDQRIDKGDKLLGKFESVFDYLEQLLMTRRGDVVEKQAPQKRV